VDKLGILAGNCISDYKSSTSKRLGSSDKVNLYGFAAQCLIELEKISEKTKGFLIFPENMSYIKKNKPIETELIRSSSWLEKIESR